MCPPQILYLDPDCVTCLLQNAESVPYPSPQPGAPKPSPASATYKPTLSGGFVPHKPDAKTLPYGGPPASGPPYQTAPVLPCQYGSSGMGDVYGYHRAPLAPKPYSQPMPASYATASSSAGPPFNVQVKVAKPVLGYNQPRRRAEPAYGPPSLQLGYGVKPPPQYACEPGSRARQHEAESWYPEPSSYGQRPGDGDFYAGPAVQGRLGTPVGQFQSGLAKSGKDELTAPLGPASSGGLRFPHQVTLAAGDDGEGGGRVGVFLGKGLPSGNGMQSRFPGGRE